MTVETVSFKNCPAIRIKTGDGAEATVLLHGAQVVSWKVDSEERLYLSDKADLSPGSAIRGGIPVCFPQFSTLGALPMHGFARNMDWRPAGSETTEHSAKAVLELTDTPELLAKWPHAFTASVAVTLNNHSLSVELTIVNKGATPLSFTTALHTYFRVRDIAGVALTGLAGTRYHDKVANLADQVETRERVTFCEQTDRVYHNAAPLLRLDDGDRSLAIQAVNMPDAVIWNPWAERAAAMPDMPDDDYRVMVCVEAASIAQPVILAPGEAWTGGQVLRG